MTEESKYILAGMAIATAIGLVLPLLLLGPFLFDSLPLSAISFSTKAWSLLLFFFGFWLLVVTIFAKPSDLKTVLSSFEAMEAVFLFLPCILYVGTKSVWRRIYR